MRLFLKKRKAKILPTGKGNAPGLRESKEMQEALWARLTSDMPKTASLAERVLFAAFEDELEKLAIFKRHDAVAPGHPAGRRTGGFAGVKKTWGTPSGSGALGVVGDRAGKQPGKQLSLVQRNLLALKKGGKKTVRALL